MKYLPRVLIVDDETHFLSQSAAFLRKNNFDVYSVADADEVFSIAKTYKPDVMVIDIRLGSHDGRDICRQLKNSDNYKDAKIILHSVLPEFGHAYKDHGADDFLLKPFTLEELIARINYQLGIKDVGSLSL